MLYFIHIIVIGFCYELLHFDYIMHMCLLLFFFFFFKQKTAYEMRISDWSPDVCSSDLTRPPVLLMDEPFAALDEFTREKLDDDLLALWESENWTVIFVTHSVYEAVYISERVLVIGARPGRIMRDLTIDAPHLRTRKFRTPPEYIQQ